MTIIAKRALTDRTPHRRPIIGIIAAIAIPTSRSKRAANEAPATASIRTLTSRSHLRLHCW